MDTLASVAQQKASDFKPQNIANMAWAYATLGHAAPELFDTLATVAQQKISFSRTSIERIE